MERAELEHRLTGFVPVDEEFSAGRYARRARGDRRLLDEGRRPWWSGHRPLPACGTLEMDLRPPVPPETRAEVNAEIERDGLEAVHARLPESVRGRASTRTTA
jgi:tRNA dimethylallyltransferase